MKTSVMSHTKNDGKEKLTRHEVVGEKGANCLATEGKDFPWPVTSKS